MSSEFLFIQQYNVLLVKWLSACLPHWFDASIQNSVHGLHESEQVKYDITFQPRLGQSTFVLMAAHEFSTKSTDGLQGIK